MDLEITQPLTEVSPEDVSGGTARPTNKADNLTAFYKPTV
jgi:hypothetical protein